MQHQFSVLTDKIDIQVHTRRIFHILSKWLANGTKSTWSFHDQVMSSPLPWSTPLRSHPVNCTAPYQGERKLNSVEYFYKNKADQVRSQLSPLSPCWIFLSSLTTCWISSICYHNTRCIVLKSASTCHPTDTVSSTADAYYIWIAFVHIIYTEDESYDTMPNMAITTWYK